MTRLSIDLSRTAVLVASLLFGLGAFAGAQEQDIVTIEEAEEIVFEAARLQGFDPLPCGNALATETVFCARTDLPLDQIEATILTYLDREGIPESDRGRSFADASQRETYSRALTITWDVVGGTFAAAIDERDDLGWSWIMFHFEPDPAYNDVCADWYDTDPLRAAEWIYGSTGGSYYHMVEQCVGFDVEDEYGQTPLIYAIEAKNPFMVEMLLWDDADPNHRTKAGWTPLMYAARTGSDLVVEPLLNAGADPFVRAPDGTTAAELAKGKPYLSTRSRIRLQPRNEEEIALARRLAEAVAGELQTTHSASVDAFYDVGCGLQQDRIDDCFLVSRIHSNGRSDLVIYDSQALELIQREGIRRAGSTFARQLGAHTCAWTIDNPDAVHVDWAMDRNGTIFIYWIDEAFGPHRDHFDVRYDATELGPFCQE